MKSVPIIMNHGRVTELSVDTNQYGWDQGIVVIEQHAKTIKALFSCAVNTSTQIAYNSSYA